MEYGRNRYNNMSEKNKKRLKEYQKIIVRLKNQNKKYLSFLHSIKMEQTLIFG